jgi:hypothetical protein
MYMKVKIKINKSFYQLRKQRPIAMKIPYKKKHFFTAASSNCLFKATSISLLCMSVKLNKLNNWEPLQIFITYLEDAFYQSYTSIE